MKSKLSKEKLKEMLLSMPEKYADLSPELEAVRVRRYLLFGKEEVVDWYCPKCKVMHIGERLKNDARSRYYLDHSCLFTQVWEETPGVFRRRNLVEIAGDVYPAVSHTSDCRIIGKTDDYLIYVKEDPLVAAGDKRDGDVFNDWMRRPLRLIRTRKKGPRYGIASKKYGLICGYRTHSRSEEASWIMAEMNDNENRTVFAEYLAPWQEEKEKKK